MTSEQSCCTAFQGACRLASGATTEVVLAVKTASEQRPDHHILIFDDATGRQIDFDLRGTTDDVLKRLEIGRAPQTESINRGPGRPRLGVVAREITLLPRHWDWLNTQPGGASVALRKLVDAARVANAANDEARLAREAADRFIGVMAGNEPGYEEATRALYAGDLARFEAETASWPGDVREHAMLLARPGLEAEDDPS